MKRIWIVLSAVILTISVSSVFADNRHQGKNSRTWNNSHNYTSYVGRHGWGNFNGFNNRGWNNRHSSRNWNRHHNGTFISLNFGSRLFDNYGAPSYEQHSHYRRPAKVIYSTTNIIRRDQRSNVYRTYSSSRPNSQRSLLRDLDGNCYERGYQEDGTEVRIELAPEDCRF